MKEILTYLPVLAIAMAMNILVGMYYQIGFKKVKFNKTIFWSGLLKAGVIALCKVLGVDINALAK